MYEFSKRWVAEGHQVCVVTSPYYKSDIEGAGFIETKNIEGIELKVVNFPDSNKFSFIRRAFNAVMFSLTSCFIALFKDYDLVLCSSGPVTVGLPGLVGKIARGKKFVFEVRDLWPSGAVDLGVLKNKWVIRGAFRFEKLLYKRSDLIAACSKGMLDSIEKRYQFRKTIVVPNSCDLDLFSSTGQNGVSETRSPDEVRTFIYAGSLGVMDDCMQLVKGFAGLSGQNARLVIIGDGVEKMKLQQYVNAEGLENVIFLGLLPKIEVAKWLRRAYAAFVVFADVPSNQTNSPNKMFDAFSAGVPIIQNTSGWIRQLVLECGCGINFEANNIKMLQDAVMYLLDNPEVRNRMAGQSLALAKTKFNRDVISGYYLSEITAVFGTNS